MLYAKINVKSNHFLFLTSLESPLNKGGSEGVWKYRWLHTFTAMLLIYVGRIMYQKIKLSFDNGYLAIVCGLVAFEVACMLGGVALNGNEYKDIFQLIVAAPAVLYIIMYIGKHIETNVVGKAIAYIGKESFYVMALHFVGFKLCTLALQGIGYGGKS